MVRQAVPLLPMEDDGGADIHLQPMEDPKGGHERLALEQAPGRTCGPVKRGAHAGAGFLAGLVTPWGTHARAVHEELQPMGRTHVGEVHGGLTPVVGTPQWSSEACVEEGAAETV
ncbi:hypothetical protein GRJ2_000453100 [Grus japonensis]|uniref:Uncharacterized protein n=1 Tax=Grus japonensis TaxID=30415 RepID=A0ABC9W3V7_GRUJA